MKISRDHYEVWFLDYLEGNLEESMIDDFLSFLQENPDLAEELRQYEQVSLQEPELKYPDRKRLYKQSFDLPGFFDSTAVSLMEGDLDAETQIAFEKFLRNHPEKTREMELFRFTRLEPETSVVFNNKPKLYRHPRMARISPSFVLKFAALFLFIWSLSVIIDNSDNRKYSQIALPLFTSENQITTDRNKEKNKDITDDPAPEEKPEIPVRRSKTLQPASFSHPEILALQDEQNPPDLTARSDQPSLLPDAQASGPIILASAEPGLAMSSVLFDLLAQQPSEEIYLSNKLVRKIGLSGLNMGKFVRWGLTLASGLTKGKFNYSTGEAGEIIALNLDTRLVGFSIPVNEKQPSLP